MKKFLSLVCLLLTLSAKAAPTVEFVVTSSTHNEGVVSFGVAVSIANPDANATSVDITVLGGGTATSGVDYTYAPILVTFPANSPLVQIITVTVADDALVEGNESFTFALANPTNNAAIGTNAQHTVTITDNDGLTVGFVSPTLVQYENIGQVNMQVRLYNPNANPTSVTVQIEPVGTTALQPADYTFNDTTITWLPDSFGTVFVPLTIIDDVLYEPTEMVRVKLTNATNGATLTTDTFLLQILNNDSVILTNCADLFFSEYEHGDADDKAMEIFNPTEQSIDMSEYRVIISYNGGDSTRIMGFEGMLAPNDVYVFAKTGSRSDIVVHADTLSHLFNWDGNDAIILLHFTDTIDVFGQPGLNPGLGFPMDYGSTWYNNYYRKKDVYKGDYYWSNGIHTWAYLGTDVKDSLGAHHIYPCGSVPPVATVRFIEADTTVPESIGSLIPVIVETINPTSNSISFVVGHDNNASTATYQADYTVDVPTYTHNTGIWYDTLYVTVLEDELLELTETAVLYLTNMTGNGKFIADSTRRVHITDNDVLTVSFNGAGFSYVEDTALVQVKLTLSGTIDDTTTVRVLLAPGNATRNVDFRFNDTTIYFMPNTRDTQSVWVTIINDALVEPNEQINFNLFNEDSGVYKGVIAYTLTIIDDDTPTGISENENDAIKLYPNPVVNTLVIETENALAGVTITGAMGNTLISINSLPAGKSPIDVSLLPPGIYFITVQQQENIFSKRFVKLGE
ncbi:MAG TPA: Calx-beta domain-containing protein [Chitinophagales bacterium]|nr:Calx-beta domain-containing protein [Chitinophagales bacterium]